MSANIEKFNDTSSENVDVEDEKLELVLKQALDFVNAGRNKDALELVLTIDQSTLSEDKASTLKNIIENLKIKVADASGLKVGLVQANGSLNNQYISLDEKNIEGFSQADLNLVKEIGKLLYSLGVKYEGEINFGIQSSYRSSSKSPSITAKDH